MQKEEKLFTGLMEALEDLDKQLNKIFKSPDVFSKEVLGWVDHPDFFKGLDFNYDTFLDSYEKRKNLYQKREAELQKNIKQLEEDFKKNKILEDA